MAKLRIIIGLAILLLTMGMGLAQGKERQRITIVLVPERNIFNVREQYEALANYLSGKLDIDIKLKFLSNYGQITDEFLNKTTDAGFFGSLVYVATQARVEIEPVARPVVMPDGTSTYSGYLFVRKDSGIKDIKDMKGKSLVLVDKATTAGYIFPLVYLRAQGIDKLGDYFSRIFFAGNHDAAAWSVYIGEADVGACKNHIFNKLSRENPDFKDKMLILAESSPVPQNALAVVKDFDPQLKEKIKHALLGLDKTQEGKKVLGEFGAARFIPTQDKDYRPLYDMLEELKIDLLNIDFKAHPFK